MCCWCPVPVIVLTPDLENASQYPPNVNSVSGGKIWEQLDSVDFLIILVWNLEKLLAIES